MSPYREPYLPARAYDDAEACPDRELISVFLLAWGLAVARVVHGIVNHETFGGEGSLAFLAVPALPFLMKNAMLWCLRRAWRRMRR